MNMSRITSLFFVVIALSVMGLLGADAEAQSEPELKTDANIQDCKACHGASAVLPNNHVDIKTNSDCAECHKIKQVTKPEKHTSLRGKLSLMHLHGLNEVGCEDCHESAEPNQSRLQTDGCLNCHESFRKLWSRERSFMGHFNPHVSKALRS